MRTVKAGQKILYESRLNLHSVVHVHKVEGPPRLQQQWSHCIMRKATRILRVKP